jgi:hypothetical protein
MSGYEEISGLIADAAKTALMTRFGHSPYRLTNIIHGVIGRSICQRKAGNLGN